MSDECRDHTWCTANALLASSVTYEWASDDYAFRRSLVPHVEALLEWKDVGEAGKLTGAQCAQYGLVYQENGYLNEAEQLQDEGLMKAKKMYGHEHPETLMAMSELAQTFQRQGRWKDAEQLQVQVLETTKMLLGHEHPDPLTAMSNLELTFQSQGRGKDAEELQVQLMGTDKTKHPEDHLCPPHTGNEHCLTQTSIEDEIYSAGSVVCWPKVGMIPR
jgi:hypothetical protein